MGTAFRFLSLFLLAAGEPRWGCNTKGSQLAAKVSLKAKQQKRSTGPSRVVPHRSTTPARTSLTSLFGWGAVSLVDMAALTETIVICNIKPTKPTLASLN